MRPIASSRPRRTNDEAFTLTEMAASLVVAAMLVAGLGEVTRQFARTTVRVRATLEETRDARLAQAEFALLERADPGGMIVADNAVTATVGDRELDYLLTGGSDQRLEIEAGGPARSAELGETARFAVGPDGAVRLLLAGGPPLLVARPRRTAPSHCRFDVVLRECR